VAVAPFEEWDPAGRLFEEAVAGQAWHWVEPVKGAAQAAAVLRPGGLLARFWNVFEPPADLAHAFWDGGGTSRGVEVYSPILAKAVDGIRTVRGFAEPEHRRFKWEWPHSRDAWMDFFPTSGGHSRLPPGRLDELLAGIGAAIDAVGGSFTMRYTTVTVVSEHAG
jgi:SAM-dependent methyltransferase